VDKKDSSSDFNVDDFLDLGLRTNDLHGVLRSGPNTFSLATGSPGELGC